MFTFFLATDQATRMGNGMCSYTYRCSDSDFCITISHSSHTQSNETITCFQTPSTWVHVCGNHQKRCTAKFKAERCMCCQVLTCMCNYALPGARRKRCRAVGNIRKGTLPGSKQKWCFFRCMCCQVLACICKCALPGARRKRCRAVDAGGLNWWEQDEEYEEMGVLKNLLFPPCQLITPFS